MWYEDVANHHHHHRAYPPLIPYLPLSLINDNGHNNVSIYSIKKQDDYSDPPPSNSQVWPVRQEARLIAVGPKCPLQPELSPPPHLIMSVVVLSDSGSCSGSGIPVTQIRFHPALQE
ncbi:hypothetical protein Hypma_003890 [Hypsizygus marmoreus]|uniref:Uncharacterized protein n=1 Tax=Hypsizygus marmoreus TaxID=39966 RepID=A0A369K6Q3_HYPMA|nr:hypothetical protein Hypma_003890 [Hypsizygus marmoreus]